MSHAGIQATIGLYTLRETELTNEMTDLMMDVTMAARETGDLARNCSSSKQAVADKYGVDSTEYKEAADKIQDEYECNLSKISAWESELEVQKKELETEIQMTSTYKESYMSMLKQNIQKDHKYGGN